MRLVCDETNHTIVRTAFDELSVDHDPVTVTNRMFRLRESAIEAGMCVGDSAALADYVAFAADPLRFWMHLGLWGRSAPGTPDEEWLAVLFRGLIPVDARVTEEGIAAQGRLVCTVMTESPEFADSHAGLASSAAAMARIAEMPDTDALVLVLAAVGSLCEEEIFLRADLALREYTQSAP
jgi:hypothetical protein